MRASHQVRPVSGRYPISEMRVGKRPLRAIQAVDGYGEFEGGLVARRVLLDALVRLSTDQREVLALRFLVGLPIRDVAYAMGRSDGAVTALQLRGLEKLRRFMEDSP